MLSRAGEDGLESLGSFSFLIFIDRNKYDGSRDVCFLHKRPRSSYSRLSTFASCCRLLFLFCPAELARRLIPIVEKIAVDSN